MIRASSETMAVLQPRQRSDSKISMKPYSLWPSAGCLGNKNANIHNAFWFSFWMGEQPNDSWQVAFYDPASMLWSGADRSAFSSFAFFHLDIIITYVLCAPTIARTSTIYDQNHPQKNWPPEPPCPCLMQKHKRQNKHVVQENEREKITTHTFTASVGKQFKVFLVPGVRCADCVWAPDAPCLVIFSQNNYITCHATSPFPSCQNSRSKHVDVKEPTQEYQNSQICSFWW